MGSDFPEAIVKIRGGGGKYLGTGIIVARDGVLTCAHVALYAGELRVQKGSEVYEGTIDPEDDAAGSADSHLDLALVRVENVNWDPLPFASSVEPATLRSWSGHLDVRGFRGPTGSRFASSHLSLRSALGYVPSSGAVSNGQIDGGLPDGLSGSPLLARVRNQWVVLGVISHGGQEAGQSTFIASDAVLRFLDAVDATRVAFSPFAGHRRNHRRWIAALGLLVLGCVVALGFWWGDDGSMLTLSGTVSAPQGGPVSGAVVTVNGFDYAARSDSDGHFIGYLRGVRRGQLLDVRVLHPDVGREQRTVPANQSVIEIQFQLQPVRAPIGAKAREGTP